MEYLRSLVYSGLKALVDVGKGVNYEELCMKMGEIPDSICAPEWEQYCNYYKEKFEKEKNPKKRNDIFIEFIINLKRRGFISSDTPKITGNFSEYIAQILSKKSQD